MPSRRDAPTEALVADSPALWGALLEILGRLGSVKSNAEGWLTFRASHESATRTFCLSAEGLRAYFVMDLERQRLNGGVIRPVEGLPAWFVDDLNEFVGSFEEPYEFQFVRLAPDGFEAAEHC